MATWTFKWPGCVLCDGSALPTAGDTLLLTLDAEKFPGFENPLEAVLDSSVSKKVWDDDKEEMVDGWEFTVTADDADMPVIMGSPASEVDECDISGVACQTCCDTLGKRVDAVEADIVVIKAALGLE